MFTKIAVLGLGKVGRLAAELLSDAGFDVAGVDARPFPDAPFPVHAVDLGDARAMSAALAGREAVLSCLPYAFNKEVAVGGARARAPLFRSHRGRRDDEAYPRARRIVERDHGRRNAGLRLASSESSARIWRGSSNACARSA